MPKSIEILLNPAVTFLIGILTIKLSRNNSQYATARERLEYVYNPLFVEIEPFLYKNVDVATIQAFLTKYDNIYLNYAFFISPNLKINVQTIKSKLPDYSSKDKYVWDEICYYISNGYDKLCKQCYIPIRDSAYRLNNNQYRNKFSLILGYLKFAAPAVLFFSIIIGLFFPPLLLIAYALLLIYLIKTAFNCL